MRGQIGHNARNTGTVPSRRECVQQGDEPFKEILFEHTNFSSSHLIMPLNRCRRWICAERILFLDNNSDNWSQWSHLICEPLDMTSLGHNGLVIIVGYHSHYQPFHNQYPSWIWNFMFHSSSVCLPYCS